MRIVDQIKVGKLKYDFNRVTASICPIIRQN